MNEVWRERLIPYDAVADAATHAYLLATAEKLHPTYSMRTFMTVTARRWLAASPQRVQGVSLALRTRCVQMDLAVRGHLRRCHRHVPLSSAL